MEKQGKLLSPVNNESVVQQAINKITDAIIAGELKPGDRLPSELELMSVLRISRNSLRSALQTLRAYGVLEVRRPEGTFVCETCSPQVLNPMLYSALLGRADSFKNLVGLREIVDMGVSKLVIAKGLSEEETQHLEQLNDELVEKLHAEPYDVEAVSEADLNLHNAIAQATDNPLAVALNDFLLNVTKESRIRVIRKVHEENDVDYLVKTHRMHLDALEKKEGITIEEALAFSTIYWKDSYNW